MKGHTNQPLTILVDTDLMEHPIFVKLVDEGHTVFPIHTASSTTEYDLILSRKAWKWDEKYVELALKAARKAKRDVTNY